MSDGMSSRVRHYLLPTYNRHPEPPIPPRRVSLVAIKIKHLVEELIPVEIKVRAIGVGIEFRRVPLLVLTHALSQTEYCNWSGRLEEMMQLASFLHCWHVGSSVELSRMKLMKDTFNESHGMNWQTLIYIRSAS